MTEANICELSISLRGSTLPMGCEKKKRRSLWGAIRSKIMGRTFSHPPENVGSPELRRKMEDIMQYANKETPQESLQTERIATKAERRLSRLFSCLPLTDIPFDRLAADSFLEREEDNEQYGYLLDCLDKDSAALGLARSLLDRFLENHSCLDTKQNLPCLRYTALMIAFKYLEDDRVLNEDFLEMFPQASITIERLNKMEVALLKGVDWVIEDWG